MYPRVGEALDWLLLHGQARMTGTGAAVFAPFGTRERGRRGRGRSPRTVARGGGEGGLNRSPLLGDAGLNRGVGRVNPGRGDRSWGVAKRQGTGL